MKCIPDSVDAFQNGIWGPPAECPTIRPARVGRFPDRRFRGVCRRRGSTSQRLPGQVDYTTLARFSLLTEADAQDHLVRLSLWRRVWIEPDETPPAKPKVSTLPPFPWNWTTSAKPDARGRFPAYLVDANGKKIAAIWGGDSERKLTADFIVDAANTMHQVDEDVKASAT